MAKKTNPPKRTLQSLYVPNPSFITKAFAQISFSKMQQINTKSIHNMGTNHEMEFIVLGEHATIHPTLQFNEVRIIQIEQN